VLPARLPVGVNVAVVPVMFTVPVTAVPPVVVASVKLGFVSVELVIGSEKVADTEEFSATPVAAFAGDVDDTVGGVVSGPAGSPPPPPPPQAAAVSSTIRPAIERTLR